MYEGLFKQNCDRSWITGATLVAAVDTWKRVTSPASHFRRLFWLLTVVCSLSWKFLFDLHTCTVHCTCHIGQTEMHKSLLSRGKVKTRDARTSGFAFLKIILYRHRLQAGIYCLNDGMDGGGEVVVNVISFSFNHAWQFADHD